MKIENKVVKQSIVASIAGLHPFHVKELRNSGIPPAVAVKNWITSVTEPKEIRQWLSEFGIFLKGKQIDSLLVFPYRSPDGIPRQPRLKVFPPISYEDKDGRQHTMKYLQAKGSGNNLYLPEGVESTVDTPLFISEGEKKSLALTHNGFPCIGLGGVWNWKGKGEDGESGPIPDLDHVNWQDREVTIVFDSDKVLNREVRQAEKALAEELTRRGAKVYIIDLPPLETKGADDYLVQYGPEAFKQLPRRDFNAPLTPVDPIPKWPSEAMGGAAGRFAKCYAQYLETPESFLFVDYLTVLGHALSGKISLLSELKPQTRLYCCNLGESADTRKSTSISKVTDFFAETLDDLHYIFGVGSAEGLAKALEVNEKAILVCDELRNLVGKMRIDGSVLLPCMCSLFESNRFHNHTKKSEIKIDHAELCLLGASTLNTYRSMFTSKYIDIGFINRLFVVIGDSDRKFSVPEPMPDSEFSSLKKDPI